jgi:hypothetical protein
VTRTVSLRKSRTLRDCAPTIRGLERKGRDIVRRASNHYYNHSSARDGAAVAWLGFMALAITGATLLVALPELLAVARSGVLAAAVVPF